MEKKKNCLYIYMCLYIYIWYMHIPYMHSALFVRDAIFLHVIYKSKPATFESQKEVVCMIHLWDPNKEADKG